MFNCYNCRKDFDGNSPNMFNNETYCNSCKKYMPSIIQTTSVINEDKPSNPPTSHKEEVMEVIKRLDEEMKQFSGYEPYKFFKCNSCGAYYEDYTSSSYENLKEAKKCCKSSVTPFCMCSHQYRWKSISDANGCCEIDEDSLELKE